MNYIDRKLLATFIAQRIEMGESEWYFNPESVFSALPEQISTQAHAATNPVSKQTQMSEVSTGSQPSFVSHSCAEELITTRKSLQELNDAVCECLRCSLGTSRKNFVFGNGNPEAGVMFIGEAPGAEEDMQGLAFVGRAGQLLTRMIQAVKLCREDVYIANILKCRPPGNRDPKADEIEKCEPILIRQIEIIKPKIICAMGRISGQTLLRTKSSLSALRGKIHDYHGFKLIVTYHPAALLRNSNWKPLAWEDLKFLRREYDGLEFK